MSQQTTPIIIEKEGVSDDSYTLVEVYFRDDEFVKQGEAVACLETSKATFEVRSPVDGYFYVGFEVGELLKVGTTLAAISSNRGFDKNWFLTTNAPFRDIATTNQSSHGIRISKAAQKLISEHDLDLSIFEGKRILTKEHVEQILNELPRETEPLDFSPSEKSIFVFGGGGHGKMCLDILFQNDRFDVVGIVDAQIRPGVKILGTKVLGDERLFKELKNLGVANAALGIGAGGNHSSRKKFFEKLIGHGFKLPTIAHREAMIESSAEIGPGNQIMQGAIIGSCVKTGSNCIINSGAIVSHDCSIGDDVHITPGAILAGEVSIGNGTVIGMGSTVYIGVKIGKNVVITNGSHVFKDIPDDSVVK